MDKIEQIKNEINKLIIPESKCSNISLMDNGRQYAYREVMEIIESLQDDTETDFGKKPVTKQSVEDVIAEIKEKSKAEDRALEAYPSTSHYWNTEPDRNAETREFYKQGYCQAEKALELTWEDVKKIETLCFKVDIECDLEEKEYYEEVLKRFKERKEQ